MCKLYLRVQTLAINFDPESQIFVLLSIGTEVVNR